MKHHKHIRANNSRAEPRPRTAFRGVAIGLLPSIGIWIGLIWLVRRMLGL